MGFEDVYQCLTELFTEIIDHRILKAIALENSMDVHAAVNDVLNDVIPNLPPHDFWVESSFAQEVEKNMKKDSLSDLMDMNSSESDSTDSETSDSETSDSETSDSETSDSISEESGVANEDAALDQSVPVNVIFISSDDSERSHENSETQSLTLSAGVHEDSNAVEFSRIPNKVTEDTIQDKTLSDGIYGIMNSFHSQVIHYLNTHTQQEYDSIYAYENYDNQIASPSSENQCPIITKSGLPFDFDIIDKTIEDSKHEKIVLFSTMQSVIDEMKELEQKEKYVENIKEEAANGELESLAKVEEMKRAVVQAKEANDMHAGEVYGEKAILANETSELHSRLFSLSDERDKSFSILDEMEKTLQARIAAVDAMLKATEEEKLAKEELSRKALAEQEALMDKVVQESTMLRQEAEENSKLREFLVDRGQLVDALQGEMSVICQDVRKLKEKFDMRVPLSESLCSSQTSCILASSGRSATLDTARSSLPVNDIIPFYMNGEKGAISSLGKEGSRTPSISSSSSSLSTKDREEERGRNHLKAFKDDGWEVLDEDALLAEAKLGCE